MTTGTVDPVIAASCYARTSCKSHNVLCASTCPLWIDLRYQTSLAALPRRSAKWTVETLPDDTLRLNDVLRPYAKNVVQRVAASQGLYFYGGVGTGKTTAVTALALSYITSKTLEDMRAGRRTRQLVQFVNVPDLLDDIKRGFDDDDANADVQRRLDALQTVPLAIFDDIASEKPSDWVRERLLTIIGGRYDNEKTCFFTSNLTLNELKEPLGARIQSRVTGMVVPIKYDGTDRRIRI